MPRSGGAIQRAIFPGSTTRFIRLCTKARSDSQGIHSGMRCSYSSRPIGLPCGSVGTLAQAPAINHGTLKAKGFTDALLRKLDAALKTAFDIKFAFNRWTLGEEFLRKL